MPDLPASDKIFSPAEMDAGFDRLAAELQPVIDSSDCVLLGILTGGMFPLVKVAERLQGDFLVDYCHATRYGGGTEGQKLSWEATPHVELGNKTVIVVDDIFDIGTTMRAVAEQCEQNGAERVLTAVMVIKDRERPAGTEMPDYDTGLHVPDRYVFGCGMDYYGRWRHLTAVYAVAEDQGGE